MSTVLIYQVTERRGWKGRGGEGRGGVERRGRMEERRGEEENSLILRTILTRTVTGAPESLTFTFLLGWFPSSCEGVILPYLYRYLVLSRGAAG